MAEKITAEQRTEFGKGAARRIRREDKIPAVVYGHGSAPIHVVGEAGPETLVVTENATVQIEAEATHIPEYFEVSVEGAEIGTLIHASDLEFPAGSTLLSDGELLIVNVTQQRSEEELEAELEEAEAEAGIERDEAEPEAEGAEAAAGGEAEAAAEGDSEE